MDLGLRSGVTAMRHRTGAQERSRETTSRLLAEIDATVDAEPGVTGGWLSGFSSTAHWNPDLRHDWRCWSQSGPTWSAHCGEMVGAGDTLGMCDRHRRSLIDGDPERQEGLEAV